MTKRALIVIDVQNEYISGNMPIEFPDPQLSLANIGKAIDAAKQAAIPVIVVQHTAPKGAPIFDKGSYGWELHDVVAKCSYDHYVEKKLASSFAGTDLGEWLVRHQIDTLTVAGYMTHNCDASTVNHAMHSGLAVEFLHDATGSLPYVNQAGSASAEEIHRVFCVVLQSNFAAVMSTDEWIAGLSGATTPVKDSVYASNQRAHGRI